MRSPGWMLAAAVLMLGCRQPGQRVPVEPLPSSEEAERPSPAWADLPYHPLESSLDGRVLAKGAGEGWFSVLYVTGLAHAVSIAEDTTVDASFMFAARAVPDYLGSRLDPQMKADFARFDEEREREEWHTSIALAVTHSEAKYSALCGGQDVGAVFLGPARSLPYGLYDACGFASMKLYPRSYHERSTTGFEVVAVLLLHELASRGGVLPLEWRFLRILVGEPAITRATYREQRDYLEDKGWLRDISVEAGTGFLVPSSFSRVAYPSAGVELEAWISAPPEAGPAHSVILLHGGTSLTEEDFELAALFLDAGWSVMLPTFRGEAANPGSSPFLLGAVDDVEAASIWLAQRENALGDIHVFGTGLGALVADVLTLHPRAVVESSASVDGLWFESDFAVFDPESWLFDPLDAAHLAPRRLFGHVDEMTTTHYAFITRAHPDPAGTVAYARLSGPGNGERAPEQLVAQPLSGSGTAAVELAARWFMRCADDVSDCPTWLY